MGLQKWLLLAWKPQREARTPVLSFASDLHAGQVSTWGVTRVAQVSGLSFSSCFSTGPALLQAPLHSSLVFSFILGELPIKSGRFHFHNHLGNPKVLGRLLKLRRHPGGRAQITRKSSWFHLSAHPEALSPLSPSSSGPMPILWSKPLLPVTSVAASACLPASALAVGSN